MKKNKWFGSLSVFVIILFLTSCGGLQTFTRLTAKDYISEENFSANITVRRADTGGNFDYFTVKKDIDALKDLIEKKCLDAEQISVEVFQDQYIFIQQEKETGNSSFYVMRDEKQEGDSGWRYISFPANAVLHGVGFIYFPYHLLQYNGDIEYRWQAKFNPGDSFITKESIDAFYTFYQAQELCEANVQENVLTVQNLHKNIIMTLTFIQTNEGTQVTYALSE